MTTAREQVTEIVAQWGLIPSPSVDDDAWQLWLDYWKEPRYAIPEKRICSKCGAEMRLRPGKYGEFYGCSRYPRCKHTEKSV